MSKRIAIYFLFGIVMSSCPLLLLSQVHDQLKWEALPALPDNEGYAGMFAGVSNGALICTGGTNFTSQAPSEGGTEVWNDKIYILEEGASSWRIASEKLPASIAFGVSCTYNNKIILVGGRDATNHYSDVISITYEHRKIEVDTIGSLPFPLANMTGALLGDNLVIAGGNSSPAGLPGKSFLALNLLTTPQERKWQVLSSWPGPARMHAVSASLNNNFLLFSGIDLSVNAYGDTTRFTLRDAYKFVPGDEHNILAGRWARLSEMPRGVATGPTPAPTLGSDHILFPGGLDGHSADHVGRATISDSGIDLLAYHMKSDSWLEFGKLPAHTPGVSAPVVKWNHRWVILNNEKGPGKTSSSVYSLSKITLFGWVNWTTLILYLAIMVWIGIIFDKKDQTTNNFFTANGKIPWWAAGLSIYGTQVSAITFMATPAIVFATDWSLSIGVIMILATVPFVVKFYLPFFRKINVTSAYEYLEYRFNAKVRIIGSLTFIFFQLGRMGIVLFLPAIAISSVTGIDIYLLISVMGIICILYTVLGGIEAVIWTDVIQVIILMGGAILCLVFAIYSIDGGLFTVISKGMEDDKFNLFHLGWDADRLVLWVAIVGFFFLNIIPYTSDQTIVQRYLTVKDERAAAKSLWTNAIISLPGIVVFYGLGTVLYIFYNTNPSSISSDNIGEILPYFVVQELPAGVAGLIIAGIFAASQSTLSSSMNSIAAAYITDIYPRLRLHHGSDRKKLFTARKVTIIAGIFGIASAMIIAALNVEFIYNLFQEVLGIVGGTLAGVFLLGIFTIRTNAYGAVCGVIAGVVAVWFAKEHKEISLYLYGAISVMTCVVVGYFSSFFFPSNKELKGLTYSSPNRSGATKRKEELLGASRE